MRPIDRWAHMMPSILTVAPQTAVDTYGKPTYGAAVSYRCHLDFSARLVPSATGQTVMANIKAHLMTRTPVPTTSKVTLSTGDVGSTEAFMTSPRIMAVGQRFDQGGLHHTELFLAFSPRPGQM